MLPLLRYIYRSQTVEIQENDGQTFFSCPCLLKNGQQSDSCASYLEQHSKYTMSRTDLLNFITLKVVNQLNQIVEMKSFTKPNYNLCI